MSFMEGNLHDRCSMLERELADTRRRCDGLVETARFMAEAMKEHGYRSQAPACWQHIVRQLRRLGVEVER